MPGLSTLLFAGAAVLLAGFVRGYSGFGFSMISIISLSLVFPPVKVVPAILLWEVAASSWLMPRIWKQIDWRALSWLGLGVAFGTPAGVYLLANVPESAMRAAIAVVVMVLAFLLWRGFAMKNKPGRPMTTMTGVISGVLNGAATVGGPPVILFFFSSPAGAAAGRASLIAFFLFTDIMAASVCLYQGLFTQESLTLAGMLLIPLVAGVTLGSRTFSKTDLKADERSFRRKVLLLLMFLSVAMLIRSISG